MKNVLEKILFAGFGGQGVLAIGKTFADACVEKGMEVSWLPSYGPEMRGGTCNCLVAVSDEPIEAPYFVRPTGAIIMNPASMVKYMDVLTTAKIVVVNTSLVTNLDEVKAKLPGVKVIGVDATDIAIKLGAEMCANMIMLGAYAAEGSALSMDELKISVRHKFANKSEKIIEMNMNALDEGAKCVAC